MGDSRSIYLDVATTSQYWGRRRPAEVWKDKRREERIGPVAVGVVGARNPCFPDLDMGGRGWGDGCVEGEEVLGRDGYAGA